MLNRPAEQFLYVLDQFIDRQISCTHPIVSAEVELMLYWRAKCYQLKLSKEEWQIRIPELARAGHHVMSLFETLRDHFDFTKSSCSTKEIYKEKINRAEGIICDLKKNLDTFTFPLGLEQTYIEMDEDRYQAGLSIGNSYIPIFEQLGQLAQTIEDGNNEKKKEKEKEQELVPLDNTKLSLLRLIILEKIEAAQFNLCFYINNRVCRKSIFHHPKMNFDLLKDYHRLSAVVERLDALTKAKVNHAINLMDQLRDLETEINVDTNDSVKHLRKFQQKLNKLFEASMRENKAIEKKAKILPYLPYMSSGYERVLERSKFNQRIF